MFKHLSLKVVTMIPQVIVITLIVFFIANHMRFAPAREGALPTTNVSLSQIENWQELLVHLLRPVQDYFYWFGNFIQGDLGRSTQFRAPVTELLERRLYNTLALSLLALILMYVLAIPTAIISAKNQGKLKDHLLTALSYIGFSVPAFIFTLLIMYVFAFRLGWLPSGGSVPPGLSSEMAGYWLGRFRHMILPAFCIAAVGMAPTFHYLKTEMVQVAGTPMVVTARAKGCSEGRVYRKHIFRNSLLPVTTSFGYQLAALLGGTIFVEMLFSYPGMAQMLLMAFSTGDQAVVASVMMLYSLATILASCLSELLTVLVDPRIKMK